MSTNREKYLILCFIHTSFGRQKLFRRNSVNSIFCHKYWAIYSDLCKREHNVQFQNIRISKTAKISLWSIFFWTIRYKCTMTGDGEGAKLRFPSRWTVDSRASISFVGCIDNRCGDRVRSMPDPYRSYTIEFADRYELIVTLRCACSDGSTGHVLINFLRPNRGVEPFLAPNNNHYFYYYYYHYYYYYYIIIYH